MDGLNAKQERFVLEYLLDFNGTKAAIRAGYSEKSAHSTATTLLKNPKVSSAMRNKIAEKEGVFDIKKNDVLNELGKIAFSNLTDVAEWSHNHFHLKDSADLLKKHSSVIKKISFKETEGDKRTTYSASVETHDKLKALELLGKHLGLFEVLDNNEGKKEYTIAFDAEDGTKQFTIKR